MSDTQGGGGPNVTDWVEGEVVCDMLAYTEVFGWQYSGPPHLGVVQWSATPGCSTVVRHTWV